MKRKKRFFGFYAKKVADVLRLAKLGFDVELKKNDFSENGENLLIFENGNFFPNLKVVNEISEIISLFEIQISIHDYVEDDVVPAEGYLYVADLKSHELLLKRSIALEAVCRKLNGRIITKHIALYKESGKEVFSEEEAKRNAVIFYKKYDQVRRQDTRARQPLIGFENNPRTAKYVNLGSCVEHFDYLFKEIKTFCTTLDVGHLQLTPGLVVDDLLEFNIQHIHFHGNDGVKDLHRLATLENLDNFYECCEFLKNNSNVSVLIEVSIKHYTDAVLLAYAEKIKKLIDWR
jgi:hypothetical protein